MIVVILTDWLTSLWDLCSRVWTETTTQSEFYTTYDQSCCVHLLYRWSLRRVTCSVWTMFSAAHSMLSALGHTYQARPSAILLPRLPACTSCTTFLVNRSCSLCFHRAISPLPTPEPAASTVVSVAMTTSSNTSCLHLPQLLSVLPPHHITSANPRTRSDHCSVSGHDHHLQHQLPASAPLALKRSFPHCSISDWNSLPAALLSQPPHSKRMQSFKMNVYRHLPSTNWLWVVDSLWIVWCYDILAPHILAYTET